MMMEQAPSSEHYKCLGMEPIDYIEANGWGKGFYIGNIIKYLARYPYKGGVDDLIKARNYIELLIKLEEKEDEP